MVNNPQVEGAGFGTETNVVSIIASTGEVKSLPKMLKSELADCILDEMKKDWS